MIKLKEMAPWMWDTHSICTNPTEMDMFYANSENANKLRAVGHDTPRTNVMAPRMLALPPDCVIFCANAQYPQKILQCTCKDC